MAKIYNEALDSTVELKRVIGHIQGAKPGPTLIFIGGIHGNEPSGVFALNKVVEELCHQDIELQGNLYALSGNLWALEKGVRFHRQDLNRLWTVDKVRALENDRIGVNNEDVNQQVEIYTLIRHILDTESGPFYFFDLHTTSSTTIPFLTVNDSLLNRKFIQQYPVPMILGIEEYLDGPFLSYINELGYVSFGFEAGQHDDPASIENHIAFIYLSLVFANVVAKESINFEQYYQRLAKASGYIRSFYEIFYCYKIKAGEKFTMLPGYLNFQQVKKGQLLAKSNNKPVLAPNTSRIFMPLYQSQGDDGFYSIRSIRPIFLALSAVLRKCRLDRIVPLLPGVRWATVYKDSLIVNRKIARFFAKQLLHLLGYRCKQMNGTYLMIKSREFASRTKEYQKESWNQRHPIKN
ncbi:succinylglutamate desuccinylase/aspartoacylase family protein [Rapidithrix thailandica]|uniref:Succinylglutamate desuccinylase/aspartoacylase family protein n=1 Tax=Rapidithrix thailandica TaxID=413964 RepID=A0AAW9SGR0_9BACT